MSQATTFRATRISVPTTAFTVLLRSQGSGNLDMSVWLTDEEALELASQLRAAVAEAPKPVLEAA